MLTSLGSLFSIILAVLTVVALLSSAVAISRANLSKSTIETLNESNSALKEQAGILADEIARMSARLVALERENEVLRSLASGSDAVQQLAKGLDSADRARAGEHHDILASIQSQQAVFVSHAAEIMELIRTTSHTHS